MTTVQVHHYERLDDPGSKLTHVADVAIPATVGDGWLPAVEYAYRATQNVDGSWSQGKALADGGHNGDFNEHVTRIVPLHVVDGKTYGIRSSAIGDIFIINGVRYRCDSIGFKEVRS